MNSTINKIINKIYDEYCSHIEGIGYEMKEIKEANTFQLIDKNDDYETKIINSKMEAIGVMEDKMVLNWEDELIDGQDDDGDSMTWLSDTMARAELLRELIKEINNENKTRN